MNLIDLVTQHKEDAVGKHLQGLTYHVHQLRFEIWIEEEQDGRDEDHQWEEQEAKDQWFELAIELVPFLRLFDEQPRNLFSLVANEQSTYDHKNYV